MSKKKLSLGLGCASVCAVLIALSGASASKAAPKPRVIFIQQDKVVAFDPATGLGAQAGTVTGDIKGATLVNFQFTITSFPNYTIDARVGITDTDGDQIIFRNVGTGHFLLPGSTSLSDPTLGGNPGAPPFQVFGDGLGGPQAGTYQVVATSGKYVTAYPIGQIFPYKAATYNPSTPPAPPGSVGSAYVEVFDNK